MIASAGSTLIPDALTRVPRRKRFKIIEQRLSKSEPRHAQREIDTKLPFDR